MIYRNGELITEVHKNIIQLIDHTNKVIQKDIGAIYKGSQLIWLTVKSAIKSCFGSGTWISNKPWLGTDYWKNK